MTLLVMTMTSTPDAYLLDTNIAGIAWDGGHKEHASIRARLATLGESIISVSIISLGEIAYGLDVTPGADLARHQAIRNAMRAYFVWAIDEATIPFYSGLRGELFRRYAPRNRRGLIATKKPEALRDHTSARELGIQENDLWIVSVAVQHDLRLITQDGKMKIILEVAEAKFSYDRYEIWPVPAPPPSATS